MATPKPANRIGQVFRLAPCLSSDELLVLLALADYGDRIFPSQAALAAKTRLHISTVKRALTGLRSKQVVTAKGYGKALTYMLHLAHAERGTSLTQSEVVAQAERGGRSHRARDPNTQTNYQPNPPPAEAGRGVAASPWEGIPEDAIRRIRRWVPEGADQLCAAQRRVTERRLLELGVARDQLGRWWSRLGDRWGDTGVPPYDNLATTLDGIGGEVRDRLAVLAFRIGVGRVAA
jgi:hypothetical protein